MQRAGGPMIGLCDADGRARGAARRAARTASWHEAVFTIFKLWMPSHVIVNELVLTFEFRLHNYTTTLYSLNRKEKFAQFKCTMYYSA